MTKIVLTNREKLELAAVELGLEIVEYNADKGNATHFRRDDGLRMWRLAGGSIQTAYLEDGCYVRHLTYDGDGSLDYVEALKQAAKRGVVETIDLTPTFAEATAICIAVIEHAASVSVNHPDLRRLLKSSEDSKLELLRYAAELDRLKKESKA